MLRIFVVILVSTTFAALAGFYLGLFARDSDASLRALTHALHQASAALRTAVRAARSPHQ